MVSVPEVRDPDSLPAHRLFREPEAVGKVGLLVEAVLGRRHPVVPRVAVAVPQLALDLRDVQVVDVLDLDPDRDRQALPLERDRGMVRHAVRELVGQPFAILAGRRLHLDPQRVLGRVVRVAADDVKSLEKITVHSAASAIM